MVEFLDSLANVSGDPLAFAAYIVLVGIWLAKSFFTLYPQRHALKIIDKFRDDKERNKALEQLVGSVPPKGLPKEDILEWVKIQSSTKKKYLTLTAYLSTLVLALSIFSITAYQAYSIEKAAYIDQIKQALAELELGLSQSEFQLKVTDEKISMLKPKARFDGMVLAVNKENGTYVNEGEEILHFVDPYFLQIEAILPIDISDKLKEGMMISSSLKWGNKPGSRTLDTITRISQIGPHFDSGYTGQRKVIFDLPAKISNECAGKCFGVTATINLSEIKDNDISKLPLDSTDAVQGIVVPYRHLKYYAKSSGEFVLVSWPFDYVEEGSVLYQISSNEWEQERTKAKDAIDFYKSKIQEKEAELERFASD